LLKAIKTDEIIIKPITQNSPYKELSFDYPLIILVDIIPVTNPNN